MNAYIKYPEHIIRRNITFKGVNFVATFTFKCRNYDVATIEAALIGNVISNLANYPMARICSQDVMVSVCEYALEDCSLLFDAYSIDQVEVLASLRSGA